MQLLSAERRLSEHDLGRLIPGPSLRDCHRLHAAPGTLVVADMGSFNGKGAIIRIQPVPNGTQTLLWGPASAVPPPQVPQLSPLGCPMGVTVEPNGNILTTAFTYPVPPVSYFSAPRRDVLWMCAAGYLPNRSGQQCSNRLNANAPAWQPNHAYAVGDVIRDETSATGHVHRVVTAGVSQVRRQTGTTLHGHNPGRFRRLAEHRSRSKLADSVWCGY